MMSASGGSVPKKIPALAGGMKLAAVLSVLAGFCLAAAPAEAARAGRDAVQTGKDKVTEVSVKDPDTTGSIEDNAELDPNCARSRKRLFVEGEGWIVRRVTTCY